MKSSFTNALAAESSPYLRQHAHNPVAWRPWSAQAWADAKREDKLVLVSIGYAACHWCHVMERECFEKEDVAEVMNRDFICLKIDREERPDVDQVYIEAVQLLSGHAGWPLNCFCLPDGKPIYGVTYQPPQQWVQLMRRLAELWKDDKVGLIEQAGKLTQALQRPEIKSEGEHWSGQEVVLRSLDTAVDRAQLSFDRSEGGTQRAPKFPLPVNWRFLLRYGQAQKDAAILKQVRLTLDKMADGGIFDQIGGGFARYSVDGIWKVPHFEKMLYDNAQLLGLYAQGYAIFKDPYYQRVAVGIAEFLQRELQDPKGYFFASLDADSEGVEGKFYVWTREELQAALGADFDWFSELRCVDERGFWEEDNYILMRDSNLKRISEKFHFTIDELLAKDSRACQTLLEMRSKRIRPGLDDKVLVSWNALAITGLVEAALWLQQEEMLATGVRAAQALLRESLQPDGQIFRSRQKGNFAISGFLEDYAHLAWACLQLHRATQDTQWIVTAEKLVTYAVDHFSDAKQCFFYFTSDLDDPLVARKMDLQDNVLPSANGVLARCLWRLGEMLEREAWILRAQTMVSFLMPDFSGYLLAHAGWAEAAFEMAENHAIVSVLGTNAIQNAKVLAQNYCPQITVVAEGDFAFPLPCLQGMDAQGRDVFILCRDKTCLPPIHTIEEVLALS